MRSHLLCLIEFLLQTTSRVELTLSQRHHPYYDKKEIFN